MDDFFTRVYQVVRQIPPGRITSYGAIAAFLGVRGAARMVGWAMNASHGQNEWVPAHRVVNRNGLLTGKHHFLTPGTMQELLENEGLRIENDAVADFNEKFWNPLKELGFNNTNQDESYK
jgi:methylated-DNA-protein-cysteine methyltransferase-like protein